jgi:hypothetical protein
MIAEFLTGELVKITVLREVKKLRREINLKRKIIIFVLGL